jgi:hypothetical protein
VVPSRRSVVVVWLLCIAVAAALTGCASPSRTELPVSAPASEAATRVPLGDGISVELASVGSTPPTGTSPTGSADVLWMVLVVHNSSDATVMVPSRPRSPVIHDADGNELALGVISVNPPDGVGAFGPAASRLGQPRIAPGGSMKLVVEVSRAADASGPLTVEYSPLGSAKARFSLP